MTNVSCLSRSGGSGRPMFLPWARALFVALCMALAAVLVLPLPLAAQDPSGGQGLNSGLGSAVALSPFGGLSTGQAVMRILPALLALMLLRVVVGFGGQAAIKAFGAPLKIVGGLVIAGLFFGVLSPQGLANGIVALLLWLGKLLLVVWRGLTEAIAGGFS